MSDDPYDFFLRWLDPDRNLAEKKYEDIRRRLLTLIELRGWAPAEDLASDAIDRFVHRLPAIVEKTKEPIPYLSVVAHNIYIDSLDDNIHTDSLDDVSEPLPPGVTGMAQPDGAVTEEVEMAHKCLDACLDELEPAKRRLVVAYYRWDEGGQIRFRRRLARLLGISRNALRIRVFNIRASLGACIENCLERHARRK